MSQAPSNLKAILNNYDEQVDWLHTLITDPTGERFLEEISPETRHQDRLEKMSRMIDFLEFSDHPQLRFNSIHVAGTSGKGSVVAMIASILKQCGFLVGFHISPYLQICNEKLVIDGDMITPSDFIDLINQFRNIYESWTVAGRPFTSLRYGDAWVAVTFLWFALRNVDWAVVETGMGGRFDATNVLPSKLAVITNVYFDHVRSLGPALTDIAYHKAGIIKNDGIVVTSATNKSVIQVIQEEAHRKNARLYCYKKDFHLIPQDISNQGAKVSIQTPFRQYNDVHISLQGTYQPLNAALAVASVDILAKEYNLPLTENSIKAALREVKFPGRLEVIQTNPLVILDGAHNPHKMQALVDSVQTIFPEIKVTALIGVLMTKDASSMIKILEPLVLRFIAARPNVFGKPSLPPHDLAKIISDIAPTAELYVVNNVRKGIELAINKIVNKELLLITGSLYLVGEARDYWIPRKRLLKTIELKKHLDQYK